MVIMAVGVSAGVAVGVGVGAGVSVGIGVGVRVAVGTAVTVGVTPTELGRQRGWYPSNRRLGGREASGGTL